MKICKIRLTKQGEDFFNGLLGLFIIVLIVASFAMGLFTILDYTIKPEAYEQYSTLLATIGWICIWIWAALAVFCLYKIVTGCFYCEDDKE